MMVYYDNFAAKSNQTNKRATMPSLTISPKMFSCVALSISLSLSLSLSLLREHRKNPASQAQGIILISPVQDTNLSIL